MIHDRPSDSLRLQVFLSRSGVCSRRRALEWIKQGRVQLNGHPVKEPSTPVNPSRDRVEVDGQPVHQTVYTYIMLNKPAGTVTTTADRHAEKTVLDLLPEELRHLNPVGRLDKDTEGLLLLTNDGDLLYRLTHPKFNVDKTYFVRIKGCLSPEDKNHLEKGVPIEGKMTAPAKIRNLKTVSGRSEFEIIIHEGRKRQIRLMLQSLGHEVIYLKRIIQGPLRLADLQSGQWRSLNRKEIELLKTPS